MPLSTSLTSNQIKNSAGTEVEFQFRSDGPGSKMEYHQVGETPNLEHRLNLAHQESGAGVAKRRRSLIRFDKNIVGQVDSSRTEKCSGYIVMDIPVGNLTSYAEPANVLAELLSFCASDGSGTTILYAGTGTGAAVLLSGGF